MTETWIDLPHAVNKLAEAQGLDATAARSALLDLIIADGVATRTRLRQGFSFEGTPDLDEPLHSSYWRDLSDLEGGWWSTGIADFGGGRAYRGIQVRENDLSAQLGEFAHVGNNTQAQHVAEQSSGQKRGPKNTYDWEGVFAHLVALANDPDGLHPDGEGSIDIPHLTKIMAGWFAARHVNGPPADSLLRAKAGKIIQALKSQD